MSAQLNSPIRSVKGMNDLLPGDIGYWHFLEKSLRNVAWQYGYQEVRTPLLEKTQLFTQSIGDQTDIVEKEMYTFVDVGKDSLTLRPEATASTVRAGVQHGLFHNQQQRLWYMGPMFRRDRPQKGRYRQFHQFGIEAFGWAGSDMDSEIIRVADRIWKTLGVKNLTLQLNTLGSGDSRLTYKRALQHYLQSQVESLDEDSQRRLECNPLRILDSKVEKTQSIVNAAPSIQDYLTKDERKHFDDLCESLELAGIGYEINSKLVRGLDYYTSTVFEWTTNQLGAQAAVCAGGRYDELVAQRGGKEVPAIGFAMGMERLIELIEIQGGLKEMHQVDVYFIDTTTDRNSACGHSTGIRLGEQLRDAGLRVVNFHGAGRLRSQLKKADQSTAKIAVILGNDEMQSDVVQIKHLRQNIAQQVVKQDLVVSWCQNYFKHNLGDF